MFYCKAAPRFQIKEFQRRMLRVPPICRYISHDHGDLGSQDMAADVFMTMNAAVPQINDHHLRGPAIARFLMNRLPGDKPATVVREDESRRLLELQWGGLLISSGQNDPNLLINTPHQVREPLAIG
ncbi:hypothetical protein [Ectothiorhodospira sp. BSL-9]|uniref:hypothetical protein n=1 Tax=Ectothiorhodospira sp. BSL-9 TaxID=1442136 RepID=UPI0007B43D27|nr:hypothetical protein [Ectothiorhodospira sp. BSL-9]ANB02843.1 hypothetical protein ECTOBSL9_2345 [Ectothiorhodospira sp. BSL-9]